MTGRLESELRAKRDSGRKLLVPYVTGGYRDDWLDVVRAIAAAGADAIELGIPFSDPLMDGPVIQEATRLALEGGATPPGVIAAAATLDAGIPLVAMTSYNICFRAGHERYAKTLASAGISGAILPDLPADEGVAWCETAAAAGVDAILLAAPTTPDDRLAEICAQSRGWIYGVGRMGVTGEREELAATARLMAKRLKAVTNLPVIIGIGIGTPEQAATVAPEADGVIVGAAVVRRMLEGATPEAVGAFVASLRAGLDSGIWQGQRPEAPA